MAAKWFEPKGNFPHPPKLNYEMSLNYQTPSDPKLQEILGRLIPVFQPEAVYLFGSQARGDAGYDSDYDLMVVVPDDAPAERKRSRIAYQALRGTGIAADIIVWTKSSFDECLPVVASLPATIKREGKLLYGG